ncbi:MAG: phosphoenolpyruvate hydrolase family protein [Chloroflexi bacterium]|nr:phosphoenolpyruvate hydrolase family protein [Chloroflexota bacterium]
MAQAYTREQVCQRLRAEIADGKIIYVAFAGTGISAKFEEIGGADLIATHILARFRMAGHSSMAGYLCIGDANQIVLDLGERDILPVVKQVPVIAGILGADPTRQMSNYLNKVKDAGFSGVLNCPTLALVDGKFRRDLEETGVTYDKEVEMIRLARQKELFTQAFVSNVEEARKMVEAGCDMVIPHMGNSSGGSIGSQNVVSLDDVVIRIQEITNAAKSINPDVLVACHGGSVAFPDDLRYVLRRTKGMDGFVGGSSAERFPTEKGIKQVTEEYKSIGLDG